MATRLVGVDSENPVLPDSVIDASVGTVAGTLASGTSAARATSAETISGASAALAVTPASLFAALPVVSVKAFGATGDGTTDDSAAIQAAIDYCVGGTVAAGAAASRLAIARLYFPPGRYVTTVAPRVVSVSGFEMFGTEYVSTIAVSGERTYGIDLDGLRSCWIHDLRIVGLLSTDTVRDALALNWTTAATRSTTHVEIDRILVHELKFEHGITLGYDSPSRQVDNVTLHGCVVNGQWESGETTWWQVGFQSGNGTHGNVLNHNYFGCVSAGNRYNVHANAVNVTWVGGDVGAGEADFYHVGSHPLVVKGVRSEHSERLLIQGVASYASSVTMDDILFNTIELHADGRFIKLGYGGTVHLGNVVLNKEAATPTIHFEGNATRPCYLTAIGLQSRSAIGSLFTSGGASAPAVVTAIDYCQINSSGQPETTLGPAVWTKAFQGTSNVVHENVEIDGALNHDGSTVGFYGATPVVKAADPGTAAGTDASVINAVITALRNLGLVT